MIDVLHLLKSQNKRKLALICFLFTGGVFSTGALHKCSFIVAGAPPPQARVARTGLHQKQELKGI